MVHTCRALIIHCKDFRIQKSMRDYLMKNDLLGDCDVASVAGGVKDRNFILAETETSLSLHKIQEVIISNHTDCGAYKSVGQFDSFKEECRFHIKEMKSARELILSKFPGLKVEMVLGKIMPDGKVDLEEINE